MTRRKKRNNKKTATTSFIVRVLQPEEDVTHPTSESLVTSSSPETTPELSPASPLTFSSAELSPASPLLLSRRSSESKSTGSLLLSPAHIPEPDIATLQRELALQTTEASTLHLVKHEQNNLKQSISANLDATYNILSEQIAELKKLQPIPALISTIEQLEKSRTTLSLAMIGRAYIEIVEMSLSSPHIKVTFSLITWLNDIFFMFSEECNGKITLEKRDLLLGTDEYIVFGDQAALLYAFVNLLKNAIKFTACTAGIKKITTSLKRNDHHFSIYVRDSGIGMTQEQAEHCFDSNRKKYNANIEGTGSGLGNVKQKLQEAGGDITVQSIQGQGSTFTITMPLEIKEVINYSVDYSSVRVLAAEDSEICRKLLKKILTKDIGILEKNIMIMPSREAAFKAYQAEKSIDIVLTDLSMPIDSSAPANNDGLDLIKDIRKFELEEKVSTPAYIIILSGLEEINAELAAARNLYNEFLKKPYDAKTLYPLIVPIAKKINSNARKEILSQFFAPPVLPKACPEIVSLIAEYEEHPVSSQKFQR